jgi:hypothetical protein
MNPRIGAAVALVFAAGAAFWFRRPDEKPDLASAPAEVEAPGDRPVAAPIPTTLAAPAPSPAPMPTIDHAKRDAMRELIYKAFGEPAPKTTAPSKATYVLPEHGQMWTGDEKPGKSNGIGNEPGIEPEYIQDSVRQQFFPVANKCYSDALATNPKLGGQIDLWFVIVGDKGVGGIVESVDVLNKSTLRDPDVIECLRESFLGVTFPAPKGGGAVTVEYPIIFSNDDDAGS